MNDLVARATRAIQHGQPDQAEALLCQAVAIAPDDPEAYYELGGLYLEQKRYGEAKTCYQTALSLQPNHPQILMQLGNLAAAQLAHQQAANYYQLAIQSDPHFAAAYYNLGNALRDLDQPENACTAYQQAIYHNPQDAEAYNNLGNVQRRLGKLPDCIHSYRQALQRDSTLHHTRMQLLHQRQHVCDWHEMDHAIAEIRTIVQEHPDAAIPPFAFLSLPDTSAAEQLSCAQAWSAHHYPITPPLPPTSHHSDKLRIAYLSADFRLHPLTWLASEVITLHNREAFEVYGYSYGTNDGSAARQDWERAFDHFFDVRPLTIQRIAQHIHDQKIDILIDLTGFTQDSRSALLALRPAPIQINWLGYPGSMGADFVDYLIGDRWVTPPDQRHHYQEKLIVMPHCYQPNNTQRPMAKTLPRSAYQLPEQGMVFCCFNQTFKITESVFTIWMQLLQRVPQSVLWLLECNPWARQNLQHAAKNHGIDPQRLVFAPRTDIASHIARHRAADLFLDTLPYNAHTTASDALWAGLPLLTCCGDTFASRVASSLLQALQLPEIITYSLTEYQKVALELAQQPEQLATIKTKLAQSITQTPLFDSLTFSRTLEQAYQQVWQRYAAHLPPTCLEVTAATPALPS